MTKEARNARVQARYDELLAEGKHGHYETLFRVVREEIEREREVCAKTADAFAEVAARIGGGVVDSTAVCGERIAEAIRARNEA